MITAEDFLIFKGDKNFRLSMSGEYISNLLIEFAQMHVTEALKQASKTSRIDLYVRPNIKGSKYENIESGEYYDILGTRQMWKINKDSILNAYPLDKIK